MNGWTWFKLGTCCLPDISYNLIRRKKKTSLTWYMLYSKWNFAWQWPLFGLGFSLEQHRKFYQNQLLRLIWRWKENRRNICDSFFFLGGGGGGSKWNFRRQHFYANSLLSKLTLHAHFFGSENWSNDFKYQFHMLSKRTGFIVLFIFSFNLFELLT